MKLLITGTQGHLGEALQRTLPQTSHTSLGIDILPSPFTDRVGNICDREFVRECMQGIDAVIHSATLHKPHIVTHSKPQFLATNTEGTLILLEEAVAAGVKAFIFTSTTSTFGDAMRPAKGEPAAWVTEALTPIPKNIYGVTKTAAEDLCKLFHRNHGLPCLVLRTSRFFLEQDDNPEMRDLYEDANIKANEFLYRRVDIADVVEAHLLAVEKAPEIGYGKYIISATTPFTHAHLAALNTDAPRVLQQLFPEFEALYASKGWKMFPQLGRVYVNEKARRELGWKPKYDFAMCWHAYKKGKISLVPLRERWGLRAIMKGNMRMGCIRWSREKHIIRLHTPHPGNELKRYQIDYLKEKLTNRL